MLFNSYEFLFAFLPATILGFVYLARRFDVTICIAWLVLASLFFYGWWDPHFLALLVGSILFNYAVGRQLEQSADLPRAEALLTAGVAANLVVLGFFKYLLFFTDNLNAVIGTEFNLGTIILPLGISFFTFEQIAYLVDVKRGGRAERDLVRYALFVAFFPRLVAGPILRASEILPQLPRSGRLNVSAEDISVGLSIFAFGLFKKAVLADSVAVYATPVFNTAATGEAVDFLTAWGGALAYTMQLYFDFSGYSDMAIGCARCFGIRFPANFASPYKSVSIVEFWRRWHITLSRFLRDYLYISLGGNRRGPARRYVNLLLTMLLGGFWHGANWTFVIWGALHGSYLIVNHAWQGLCARAHWLDHAWRTRPARLLSWSITFLAVVVGWVFFRAANVGSALEMLRGMAGMNGFEIPAGLVPLLGPAHELLAAMGVTFGGGSGSVLVKTYATVGGLLFIALFMPNVQELFAAAKPTLESDRMPKAPAPLQWRPSRRWATATAAVAIGGILSIWRAGEFLYWQF